MRRCARLSPSPRIPPCRLGFSANASCHRGGHFMRLGLLLAGLMAMASPGFGQTVGLLIGNENYEDMRNIRRGDMIVSTEEALERAGFDMISRRNANLEDLLWSLSEFGEKAARGGHADRGSFGAVRPFHDRDLFHAGGSDARAIGHGRRARTADVHRDGLAGGTPGRRAFGSDHRQERRGIRPPSEGRAGRVRHSRRRDGAGRHPARGDAVSAPDPASPGPTLYRRRAPTGSGSSWIRRRHPCV